MKVAFVDLDGVVVAPGTKDLRPGALEELTALNEQGWAIWYFSSWGMGEEEWRFLETLVPYAGFISKPLADRYIMIDDKLDVTGCRTAL